MAVMGKCLAGSKQAMGLGLVSKITAGEMGCDGSQADNIFNCWKSVKINKKREKKKRPSKEKR